MVALTERAPTSTLSRVDDAIDRHYREIVTLAIRTVGPASAEDVAQETFIKVARNIWRLDDSANVRAWVYKIAVNTCRDHLRKRRGELELLDGHRSLERPVDQQVEQKELLKDVNDFLLELPQRQREAFVLKRLQGLDYIEIAETMNCSQDAARANVYQAFKKLRLHFSGRLEEYK